MRVFKTKHFARWAEKEGLSDDSLGKAIDEMERGLVDVDLGGHLFKKRVVVAGRGKRGGARTLLAFRRQDRAFFLYGFAKNKRTNVSEQELKALKMLSRQLLNHSDEELTTALISNALFEVENDE